LRDMLKTTPAIRDLDFTVSNDTNAKPVADGAVIWFVKRSVTARATRLAFGTDISMLVGMCPAEEEHGRRPSISARGPIYTGAWSEIVKQNTVLAESDEILQDYRLIRRVRDPGFLEETIYAYDGLDTPLFMQDPSGNAKIGFEEVCVVRADLSNMKKEMVPEDGMFGRYWSLPIKIAIKFGGTELSASVLWDKNGTVHRGPASIIPASFV